MPDVLRLLATTGKSGCLHIEGDRGRGSVWLEDGAVVGATSDRALDPSEIDEVIFEMLRFVRGSFNFAADEQVPENGQQPKDVESTLRRATQLLDEWRDLERVVPSLGHRVAMAPELTVDQVTIDASRWEALVAIGGGRSISELAEMLKLGELSVSRAVSDLVELGVAVVEPPGAARVPATPSRRSSGESSTPSRGLTNDTPRRTTSSKPEPTSSVRETSKVSAATSIETAPKSRARQAPARPSRGRRTGPTPTTTTPASPPRTSPSLRNTNGNGNGNGTSNGNGNSHSKAPVVPPAPVAPSVPPAPMLPPSLERPAIDRPPSHQPPTLPTPMPEPGHGLLLPPSLDTGRLGPSPVPIDTGQIPAVAASALPPDLSWAADDSDPTQIPSPLAPSAPPGSSVFRPAATGRLVGPPPAPAAPPAPPAQQVTRMPSNGRDGDTAPHVAALSPEARSAVEATIGRSGGGPGGMLAGASPDQVHSRTQLLHFLSTVRP